jgi:hypothetical protein
MVNDVFQMRSMQGCTAIVFGHPTGNTKSPGGASKNGSHDCCLRRLQLDGIEPGNARLLKPAEEVGVVDVPEGSHVSRTHRGLNTNLRQVAVPLFNTLPRDQQEAR